MGQMLVAVLHPMLNYYLRQFFKNLVDGPIEVVTSQSFDRSKNLLISQANCVFTFSCTLYLSDKFIILCKFCNLLQNPSKHRTK